MYTSEHLLKQEKNKMAIYLKVPSVTGGVTTQGFKGWIEVDDLDGPSVSSHVKMKTGSAVNRYSSTPQFEHITFIKVQDGSSNDFFAATHNGTVFSTVEFNYVSTGTAPVVYSKLVLYNAMITSYSERHSGSSTGQPQELITLAFTKMEKTFIPRDGANQSGSPSTTGYDIENAKRL
jgi:type VI protein secretion system component Hcp